MQKITIITFFLLAAISVNCQESFELLIPGPGFESPGDLHIDDQGNYIIVGVSMDLISGKLSGIALKISPFGEVIINNTYEFPDTSCNFFNLVKLDSSYLVFGGIGPDVIGLSSLLICSFDFDLNLLWRKSYKVSNTHLLGGFKSKVDLDGNIIIMGVTLKEVKYYDSDPFEFRCTISGDSLFMLVETLDYNQRVFDFLIMPDSTGYISFGSGQYPSYPYIDANAAYYDHFFYRGRVREVPNNIYWSHTVKWINDEEFFISGNKHIPSPLEIHPVGLMKLDTAFSVIDDVHFGVIPDTACYPAWVRSFDYLDLNNIFFAWTKNFDDLYQNIPAWIMLSKFDSTLNLLWERYYGGDAMYSTWLIDATEDGGSIITSMRYDYSNQDNNFDLYLIKTDENGLITSINEESEINDVDIYVSPIPCTDKITFNKDLSLIEIFNQSGQLVLRFENYSMSKSINVDYFNPGIYIYRIIDREGYLATGKLIKK